MSALNLRLGIAAALTPHRAETEALQGLEPAERLERLFAPVQPQQAALLQRLPLQLPEHFGPDGRVADQRETEGVFRFVAGQAGRRIADLGFDRDDVTQ
jgi:hypothetical protein